MSLTQPSDPLHELDYTDTAEEPSYWSEYATKTEAYLYVSAVVALAILFWHQSIFPTPYTRVISRIMWAKASRLFV